MRETREEALGGQAGRPAVREAIVREATNFSTCLLFALVIAMLVALSIKQRRRYEEQAERLERIETKIGELKARIRAEGGEDGIQD